MGNRPSTADGRASEALPFPELLQEAGLGQARDPADGRRDQFLQDLVAVRGPQPREDPVLGQEAVDLERRGGIGRHHSGLTRP